MRHPILTAAQLVPLALFLGAAAGCSTIPDPDDPLHPKGTHLIFPDVTDTSQRASGPPTDEVLEQPIAFSHYRHVTLLEMDCQYCHVEARRSIHSAVPPLEVCMGCHSMVLTQSEEVKKIAAYWAEKEPIPWKKVHDLPDYVYFAHKPHIRAGVDCLECHPGVDTMGQWPDKDPTKAQVMVRRSSLQMGWCLDCHQTHATIDENYGELSDLRRAELKDCWTCHK